MCGRIFNARIFAGIVIAAALSGCVPSTRTPDRLYPVAVEMDAIRAGQGDLFEQYRAYILSDPVRAKTIRNEIIAQRMYASTCNTRSTKLPLPGKFRKSALVPLPRPARSAPHRRCLRPSLRSQSLVLCRLPSSQLRGITTVKYCSRRQSGRFKSKCARVEI